MSGYSVYYGRSSGSYTDRLDVAGSGTAATIDNLLSGKTYYFAVTARNTAGLESTRSSEISYTVPKPTGGGGGGKKSGSNSIRLFSATSPAGSPNVDAPVRIENPGNAGASSVLLDFAVGYRETGGLEAGLGVSSGVVQRDGNSYLTLTFSRRKAAIDLEYTAEVSADNAVWWSGPEFMEFISAREINETFEVVTLRDLVPLGSGAARYARLRVTTELEGGRARAVSESFAGTATILGGATEMQSGLSQFALQTVRPVVYSGTISEFGPRNITDAGAKWRDGQFNGASGYFYVEFESGEMADIERTDGTTKTIYFPGDLGASIGIGQRYKIRRHSTLATVFGPSNETGLLAGATASEADTVMLHVSEIQETQVFFFSNAAGASGWYRGDHTPADNTIIYPEQGVMVTRKSAGDLVLYMHGVVKSMDTVAPLSEGYNLVGTLKTKGALRLSELNIMTSDVSTGLMAGPNSAFADNLIVVQSDGSTATYFYCNAPGFTGWFDTSFRSADHASIPAGSAFVVLRRKSFGPFNWTIPGE